MKKDKTLVLGASPNPARYSFLAIERLRAHQQPVIAVGRRKGSVAGVDISTEPVMSDQVDTVTLYMNPRNQEAYYNYILDLHPRRIIFNPGTENPELMKMAREKNIETVVACTLVMLSTNQYS